MGYTFAPVTDFEKLLAPLEKLYGREKAPRQMERYRGAGPAAWRRPLARRSAAPCSPPRVARRSAGNHTDHQHGRVLAGSVDLDVIAAVKPSGDGTIRIQSEGFPMDVVDLSDLSVHEEERNRSVSILRGLAAWFSQRGCRVEGFDAYTTSNVLKGSGLSSQRRLRGAGGQHHQRPVLRQPLHPCGAGPGGAVRGERLLRQAQRPAGPDGLLCGGHGHRGLQGQRRSGGGAGGLRLRRHRLCPVHHRQRSGPRGPDGTSTPPSPPSWGEGLRLLRQKGPPGGAGGGLLRPPARGPGQGR